MELPYDAPDNTTATEPLPIRMLLTDIVMLSCRVGHGSLLLNAK
jgi:hypothetical protein